MNFVVVAIVFAIVFGHSFNKRVKIWLAQTEFSFVLITVIRSSSTCASKNVTHVVATLFALFSWWLQILSKLC